MLTVLIVGVWVIFFDKNNIFSQIDRHREVVKLQQEADYYKNEIDNDNKTINSLKTDPKFLEKFAREQFHMKKDNEDVYVLVEDTLH